MSLDLSWSCVRDFHQSFGHPTPEQPQKLTADQVSRRLSWMLEELDEFKAAGDLHDQADSMIDLIYFALGTLVEMGVRPARLFDIVHEANMSKVKKNGERRYGTDGKVLKPSTWKDPRELIINELARQSHDSQ